jgi:hypothetical protein
MLTLNGNTRSQREGHQGQRPGNAMRQSTIEVAVRKLKGHRLVASHSLDRSVPVGQAITLTTQCDQPGEYDLQRFRRGRILTATQ